MNKILSNFKFRMGYQRNWFLWNLAIYFTIILVVFYALIQTGLINKSEGSLVYRIWLLVFFQFSMSVRFKEDFDFFLAFSNTRKEIFYSFATVGVTYSVLISGIIVLEKIVIDFLNGWLGFQNVVDPFHFFAPYASDNLFLLFLFFLMLSILTTFLGLLLGSLFYRFGKLFRLIFWIAIFFISAIYLPLLMWSYYQENRLTAVFSSMGEFFGGFNVLASSGYLLLIAIVLGAAAFLNMRRLPQK